MKRKKKWNKARDADGADETQGACVIQLLRAATIFKKIIHSTLLKSRSRRHQGKEGI